MAEQLRIKGRHKQRFDGHAAAQPIQLLPPPFQKMPGVGTGAFDRLLRLIGLLAVQASCRIADPMQFQAQGTPGGQTCGFDLLGR